jgi:hypothetical protein
MQVTVATDGMRHGNPNVHSTINIESKTMKTFKRLFALAGAAALLLSATGNLSAQERPERPDRGDRGPGRGNFDPEQMRARMMERYREALEVKDDAEWKLIEGRITKVTDARRDLGGGMGRMFGGPGGPGGRGGDGGRRGGFFGEPSPEAEALQKAIEAKASADEIKTKLAKYRESQKAKQAALEKAQAELRQVLSVKQEAQAVLMGLLQ